MSDDADNCSKCGSGMRVAVLDVVAGNPPERLHFLKPRSYVIGRARASDLRITEPSVSKTHARIVHDAGHFYVEDHGSLHGVFLNAVRVQRAELKPGCNIQLGNVTLRFSPLDAEGSTGEVALYPWVEQQQLLLSLVQTLNSSLVLSEVLGQVLDAVMSLTRAERGYLLLVDHHALPGSGKDPLAALTVRACRGRDGSALDPTLGPTALVLVQRAAERGQTASTSDLLSDAGSSATVSLADPRAAVCMPLRSQRARAWGGDGRHDVLGAIYVDNYTLPFSPETLRAAEGLARHAALALENALLFEREQHTIDELRRTQKQLVHSEKLATIGMMAAGIAHELNTPLTYILGNIELMSLKQIGGDERELLESMEKGAMRLKALAQNLLAFSRPAKEEPVSAQVNDLIERSLELCRYPILKGGIRVEKALAAGLPPIRVVPSEIETAFINLLMNAVQVMPRGGTLGIVSEAREDGTVQITVSDTGPGIPEEVRATIFEPFVTTKPEGQGTGLGLSTTLLVLERHNGRIAFTTETGHGATFRVTLPCAASADATPSA